MTDPKKVETQAQVLARRAKKLAEEKKLPEPTAEELEYVEPTPTT